MEPDAIVAHPIRDLIANLLSNGDPYEEPIVLCGEAQQVLEHTVDEYAKACTPELMLVAQTMFSIADWLEDNRCSGTAQQICAVLDRSNVLSAMQLINDNLRIERGTVEMGTPGDDFASFASVETGRRAPEVNEPPPENAVKAGSLDYPKRL